MLPKQGRLGRPRETDLREVSGAIQYVLATDCQRIFRPIQRSSTIFTGGKGAVFSIA